MNSKAARKEPKLSVVAPMLNESAGLAEFYRRTSTALLAIGLPFEVICVDDGSRDETARMLREICQRDPRFRAVILSRNFGKEIAMSAGLEHARGEWVVPIDADLQDPPEMIAAMLQRAQEGYDVVYARRQDRRGESFWKTSTAGAFYNLIRRLTDVDIPENTGDFRLMHRRVVDALLLLGERRRFMKGLFSWVGFRQVGLPYVRDPRHAGSSKWNYWRLWNFALDGITSFSSLPLRIWSYIGAALATLSFAYAGFLIIRVLAMGIDIPGYASLMVVVLFIGGIQLITLGVIGEYLGRVFEEVKSRPLYLVREKYGFSRNRGA